MPTELVVALILAVGGIIAAVIAGSFNVITARSTKALSANTSDIAAVSAQALALVEYYKEMAEDAEKKLTSKSRTIATQSETIDTLVKRQDALRKALAKDE